MANYPSMRFPHVRIDIHRYIQTHSLRGKHLFRYPDLASLGSAYVLLKGLKLPLIQDFWHTFNVYLCTKQYVLLMKLCGTWPSVSWYYLWDSKTLPLCTIAIYNRYHPQQTRPILRLLPIINLCRVRNTISTATDINRSTPSPWNWMYCTCLWRQPRLHTPRTPSPRLPTVGQDFVIVIITASALVHPSQPLPSPPTPNSSPSVFWSLGKIMTSVNRPIVIVSLRSMYGLAEIHQSSLLVAKVSIR